MILLELQTESGAKYVANVINQRIRRIAPDGNPSEWDNYVELCGGDVGSRLYIYWPDTENPTITTPVVKIDFPEVEA